MIKVFNKDNTSFLSPKHIFNRYVDLNVSEVLGGEETFEFSIPFNALPSSIQTEDFVEFDGNSYIIKRFTVARTDTGKLLKIECNGIYELLIDKVIEGEDTWLAGVTMRAALERALIGTLFSVGLCDDFGTWDIELGEMNSLEAVNAIKDAWPGKAEIYFDGFTLNAVAMRGTETNVHIAYNKNLGTIEKLEDSSDLVTRLKGRGKDGMTIQGLDVTSIAAQDLTGFVIDTTSQPGKKIIAADYVNATTINDYAIPKEAIKEWSDLTDQMDLFNKMKEYILQIYKPKVSYTASFAELSKQGVNFADINLGDWVWVNDSDLGIEEKVRVVELSKNPDLLEECSATLATRQSTMIDFMADLKDTKNLVDEIGKGFTQKFSELETAIANATKIINAGNSTVLITETDGIMVIDTETLGPGGSIINTTKLIHIANGAIGCSVDGGTTYRTAMTGDGIHADAITVGRVAAQNITVGSLSDFEAGYHPDNIRSVVYTEMDNTKQSVLQRADINDVDITHLNDSVQQTNTAMTMLDTDIRGQIDLLNQDVSGLNGNVASVQQMYSDINDLIRTNSYFYWDTAGLKAIETDNTQNQMLLSSTGLGLSTDGGNIFTNAITARGIVASQINIGVLNEEPFKGLTIHNGVGEETFVVDTNGSISLTGNINMVGGSIAWQAVSKMPYDALDDSFKNRFTYIDSEGIYTKTIKADQLDIHGLSISDNGGNTTFSVGSAGDVSVTGTIHMKAGSSIEWDAIAAPTPDQVGAASQGAFNSLNNDFVQRTTRITQDGIYTGQIDAQQISVGKIQIGQIDTTSVTPDSIGAASLTKYNTLLDKVNANENNTAKELSAINNSTASMLNAFRSDLNTVISRYVDKDNVTPLVTQITDYAIQTHQFSADQITSGTLTSVTIDGAVIYADDKMFIGKRGKSITNTDSHQRKIVFDDYYRPAEISYELRSDNDYSLVLRSDGKIINWASNSVQFHNHPKNVRFSKYGTSGVDSPSTEFFTMQDIVNALKRLGEDIIK